MSNLLDHLQAVVVPHSEESHRTGELARAGAFFDAAMACARPVALWRRPQAEENPAPHIEGIISLGEPESTTEIDFTRRRSGFVFAPFSNRHEGIFLRDDVRLEQGDLFVSPHAAGSAARLQSEFDERIQRLRMESGDSRQQTPATWYTAPEHDNDRAFTQEEFEALVTTAIEFVNQTGIEKVVVSRMAPVDLPEDFHPARLFAALCDRYPRAFVSLVSAPGIGTWLGATPELLLGLDGESLNTVALAGTQKRNGVPIEQIRWGRKEIAEQELVSAYIRSFFANAGMRNVNEQGPVTSAAGGVVHLKTRFRVCLPEAERLRLANRVLSELHPTSAVCGMPRREALAFILEREGYDRAFYSGYLGPVHVGERSELYVNLRCMQLRRCMQQRNDTSASTTSVSAPRAVMEACLYVGAGVTAESNPAAEWRETELKARTILDALHAAPQARAEPTGTASMTRAMEAPAALPNPAGVEAALLVA